MNEIQIEQNILVGKGRKNSIIVYIYSDLWYITSN